MGEVVQKICIYTAGELIEYLKKYCNQEDRLAVGISDEVVIVKHKDDGDNIELCFMEPSHVDTYEYFDDLPSCDTCSLKKDNVKCKNLHHCLLNNSYEYWE